MSLKINRTYWILILLTPLFLFSCSDSDDDMMTEPPVTDPDEVETLALTFIDDDALDAMAIDSKGNIYISNVGKRVNGSAIGRDVIKITPDGVQSVFATFPLKPSGLAVDAADNLYVGVGNGVYQVTPDGTASIYASSGNIGFSGLAIDENGVLYSSGYSHNRILKVGTDRQVEILVTNDQLRGSVGIVYDQETKSLYAGNFDNGRILKITLDGTITEFKNLNTTIGYLTEMNGVLYATLFNQNRITQINIADGVSSPFAGTGAPSQTDGVRLGASFTQPNGVVGNPATSTLYVGDYIPARVAKIKVD